MIFKPAKPSKTLELRFEVSICNGEKIEPKIKQLYEEVSRDPHLDHLTLKDIRREVMSYFNECYGSSLVFNYKGENLLYDHDMDIYNRELEEYNKQQEIKKKKKKITTSKRHENKNKIRKMKKELDDLGYLVIPK